jgi:perosamine synthetase
MYQYRYCGPPGLTLGQLFSRGMRNNVMAWFNFGEVHLIHKGRTGIRQACHLVGLRPDTEVLAPAYCCGSEIDALIRSGARVVLYRITRDCSVDLDDLQGRITRKTRAIYLTHYFGFAQRIDEIIQICTARNLRLIEDCALSLFSLSGLHKVGEQGDLSIFSLPKTLPVPDGGVLVVNNKNIISGLWQLKSPVQLTVAKRILPLVKASILRNASRIPSFCRTILFLNKWAKAYRRKAALRTNEQRHSMPTDYYFDDKIANNGLSNITAKLMKNFDVDQIRERRRANYRLYLSGILDFPHLRPLFPKLPDGVCPLNFPVIVDNRSELCAALNQRGIAAIKWWSGYHQGLAWDQHPEACFLKDHILALPVHQDLVEKDIAYILETIEGLT